MDNMKDTFRKVIGGYAGKALNGYSYLTTSPDETVFTVIAVGKIRGERFVNVGLVVRLIGERIVVERDVNEKPLVDALMQAGIPQSQIVLAYGGEA